MKIFYLFFISQFIFQFSLPAQDCLPSGIILHSQEEVDSFPLLFPGCESIKGPLTIDGAGITNLEALSVVISVQGDLSIQNTTLLTSLHGLHNLTNLGGSINLQFNQSLSDLSSFSSINTINGDLRIRSNQQLQELIGFESVVTIKDSLIIINNPQILSLNFEQLKSVVSGLSIINNDRLKHLYGFEGITFQLGGIKIFNNDSLMDYHGFDNLSVLRSELYLDGNPMALDFSGFESLKEVSGLILDKLPCRDLTGFSALQRIRGNLEIALNDKMESLQGVPLLQKIDVIFAIYKLNRLKNLDGLNQLQEIRDLRIQRNDSIISLQGLNGLRTISANIDISDNPMLQDITALLGSSGLTDQIRISKNKNLESLYGLDNLCISPISEFIIEDNPNLSICNNPCLCAHLLQGGPSTINGNSPGCNTSNEIITSCMVASHNPESNYSIQVSPNPANQFLQISGLPQGTFQYSVFDILGHVIEQGKAVQPVLDIQTYSTGLYLLVINSDDHITSHSFAKF